jgi:hypothetical protein
MNEQYGRRLSPRPQSPARAGRDGGRCICPRDGATARLLERAHGAAARADPAALRRVQLYGLQLAAAARLALKPAARCGRGLREV